VLSAGSAAGIGGRLAPLLGRLGDALGAEGVNVGSVVSIFSGETALAVAPAPVGRTPAVVIVARTSQAASARAALASLAVPLAQLFSTGGSASSQAPVLSPHQVGAATVEQVALTPGLQLDYAVTNGLVIVSTQLSAVSSLLERRASLSSDAGYRATLPDSPSRVTSLLFLDFSQLLYLGEQTGLTQGTRYRALAADLARIRTAGLESTGGEADTTAELLLQIS
jgi:hypothetical protein